MSETMWYKDSAVALQTTKELLDMDFQTETPVIKRVADQYHIQVEDMQVLVSLEQMPKMIGSLMRCLLLERRNVASLRERLIGIERR